MESWFAPAITPTLTYLWKVSLVSSLQGGKPVSYACGWNGKWENGGLSDSYLGMKKGFY